VTNIEKKQRINEAIRAGEVRLIDESGEQIGVVPLSQALAIARERDLDLVEVAPQAAPPVCRLMDYGKYIYERAKREKEARKSQRVEIKEIRLRPKTGHHDRALKVKRIRDFLTKGCKVKVRVLFRGRERSHPEIGRDMLQGLAEELGDMASVEQHPKIDGRSMLMILAPGSEK
jgi:translation initiation factor IF-3